MYQAINELIRAVGGRLRKVMFWRLIGVVAILAVGYTLVAVFASPADSLGPQFVLSVSIGFVVAALSAWVLCRLHFRDPRSIAAQIEAKFPSLQQRLLTALSQRDQQLGYLQQQVVREAFYHAQRHRWLDTVPTGRLAFSRLLGIGGVSLLVVLLGRVAWSGGDRQVAEATGGLVPQPVQVEPGNAEIERGTSLVVTARFGQSDVPETAQLICTSPSGETRTVTMRRNLNDPVVGGFLAAVEQPFRYQVVTPTWQSELYAVDVFDFPALRRSDAHLNYPKYTGLPEKLVEDTVRVSAIEGTEVTWICFLNKPVATAELVSEDGNKIPLVRDEAYPDALVARLTLVQTQRLKLQLVDDAGRTNKFPPELIARVLPNQIPELKLTSFGDVSVSPLEELPLEAEVHDDVGVANVGLSYSLDGSEPTEIVLGSEIPRGAKSSLRHLVELERLQAEPDQLFAYHFWAEDHGPDGQLRRTQSDMYFAEVRPFDQIFREGQAPAGGDQQQQAGQNGQQAGELAELQKEIINATWRVVRDERGETRSESFTANVDLLLESQGSALQQLQQLARTVRDARSRGYVDDVGRHMQEAISQLRAARSDQQVQSLPLALRAEQLAYAGLLKLRAREFQVSRSQASGSQSGSASQRQLQQQLNELELEQDENRYESERQARAESAADQQQREVRQILNRLRELARRQQDLNKEIAELQNALQAAETAQQRDEIERRLKRLRDQQQDLLRETDELSERMQQPQNQQRMQQANEQLQETRQNVQQAAEALDQQDTAQALSSGRRAERQFEEMRDEFRRQASGQFDDAVKEMRRNAQQLDQQEDELAERIRKLDDPAESPGIRGDNDSDQIREDIDAQRRRLETLLQQMQDTVEEAEIAEPLLAQNLYDSFRRTRQQRVDRQLQNTSELLRRGFTPQAREMERGAAENIRQLREDLEQAAESVLGDETKALERALDELEQLERELAEEIDANRPATPDPGAEQGGQRDDPQQNQSDSPRSPGQAPEDQDARQPGSPQPSPAPDQPGTTAADGQSVGQSSPGRPPGETDATETSAPQPGQDRPRGGGGGGAERPGELLNRIAGQPQSAPIGGDDFREWSDRLRDVEEMVDDPELRNQAAGIRDRAREMRRELRRNNQAPQWDLVDKMIAVPLRELKQLVAEELLRRSAERNAPVPIDRDPVPAQFSDAVRRYYESLGGGRK